MKAVCRHFLSVWNRLWCTKWEGQQRPGEGIAMPGHCTRSGASADRLGVTVTKAHHERRLKLSWRLAAAVTGDVV